MLDLKSLCALARCNRSLKKDAESRFALATQGSFKVESHNLAPDMASRSPGLLQYHPNIHVCGPWKTLKRLPGALIQNVTCLDIHKSLGLAKGFEAMLASTRRLQELTLSCGAVKSSTAVRLFRTLRERERMDGAVGLRTLQLISKTFGREATIELIAYLTDASQLIELSLYGCTFKRDYLHLLADTQVLHGSIRALNLNGSKLGLHSELTLSKILRGCPALTTLDLTCTRFGTRSREVEALADAILDDNCKLQSLIIFGGTLGCHGASVLAATISKLHKIELGYADILGYGICAIGDAIKTSKTITDIGLSNNTGVASSIEAFSSSILVNKSLQVLDLYNCEIGTSGMSHLKDALVGKVELRELILYRNNIDEMGCYDVAEIMIACPSLKILDLAENKLGRNGVRTIAVALRRAKRLQKLRLNRNGVVDDASTARLFEAIEEHSSLSHVSINKSRWKDGFSIGKLATVVLARLKPDQIQIEAY
jgi:Ran GTPase-activating protein 1